MYNHLFDLPAFGVVFDDIEGREMEIGGDKVTGFLSFLFYYHNSGFAEVFNEADKPSDLKRSAFPIKGQREFSIGRADG